MSCKETTGSEFADPSRVVMLAHALNVCTSKVFLVGCQPDYVDDAVEGLSPSVERAVPLAVEEVQTLVRELWRANPAIA